MDEQAFTEGYFKFLVKKMLPCGYDPQLLIKTIWGGVKAMAENDGSVTNEAAFWKYFCSVFGEKALDDKPLFEEFYAVDFKKAQSLCGFAPEAKEVVDFVKAAGCRTILATNPIFPATATDTRIGWAGLVPSDFELITTYENIGCAKPNPEYFREVLRRAELQPEECLMIGNDAVEDTAAEAAGIRVFLLTDCLINKKNADLSAWPHGDFAALKAFLASSLK